MHTAEHNPIIEQLQQGGERITPLRASLVDIFLHSHEPFTPQELLQALVKQGFKANKTTVYRQLEFLQRNNIIKSVHFADRTKRYELIGESGHHHHLVCLRCGRIEDVSFPTDLEEQEKLIWKKNKFKVLQHSLEFFGLCQTCQAKVKN